MPVDHLPATKSTRPRDPFTVFFCWGMERLTRSLLDGEEFGPDGTHQLNQMARRCRAFLNAYDARIEQAEQRMNHD